MYSSRLLIVLAIAFLALWGCSKKSAPSMSTSTSPSPLETRVAKLEEELKKVQESRELLVAEMAALRTRWQNEVTHTQTLTKERDTLKAELKVRTGEKETLQAQFDGFRKELRDLVGQMDAATLPPPVLPGNPASASTLSLPGY
jgi:DNA repair exonuclease SbcCD ATPase subunit